MSNRIHLACHTNFSIDIVMCKDSVLITHCFPVTLILQLIINIGLAPIYGYRECTICCCQCQFHSFKQFRCIKFEVQSNRSGTSHIFTNRHYRDMIILSKTEHKTRSHPVLLSPLCSPRDVTRIAFLQEHGDIDICDAFSSSHTAREWF